MNHLIGQRSAVRSAGGTVYRARHHAVNRFNLKGVSLATWARDSDFHNTGLCRRDSLERGNGHLLANYGRLSRPKRVVYGSAYFHRQTAND